MFGQRKVIVPAIRPWIEQRRQFVRDGINRCDIGPLEPIAVTARQAQIIEGVRPLALPRADMLNMKAGPRLGRLNQSAILTDVACSFANLMAKASSIITSGYVGAPAGPSIA